jgi:glycosyltransferase involved in cell wall biosynthesis
MHNVPPFKDRGLPPSVALFASAFHPSLGGVEELCRQLAHEYRGRGWRVCVVTNRWPRGLPDFEMFEGIPVFRVAMRTPGAGIKSEVTYRLTSRFVQRQVAKILREQQTSVIHVQCAGCNAHYARRAAKALGLPMVVSLQGELSMDATRLFERSAFARQTLRAALSEADSITACSQQTLAEAETFQGTRFASEAQVIHNGIRISDFANASPFQHARRYVLAMGRHVPQKGFDVLLRAMALLWHDGLQDLDLILAGDGPERASLENLAGALGVSDRVVFAGRADRVMTAALFAGCELFVLPSRHEPFGIVNLEAMACGKAVVATRTGGVPEIVRHGDTGWLVSPEDPAALAQGIAHVLRERDLRLTLAINGRKLAQRHDWAKIGDAYETVYRTVLEKRTRTDNPAPMTVDSAKAMAAGKAIVATGPARTADPLMQ